MAVRNSNTARHSRYVVVAADDAAANDAGAHQSSALKRRTVVTQRYC